MKQRALLDSEVDLIVYDTLSAFEEDESPHYYRPTDSHPAHPDVACMQALNVIFDRAGEGAGGDETLVTVGFESFRTDRLHAEVILQALITAGVIQEVE